MRALDQGNALASAQRSGARATAQTALLTRDRSPGKKAGISENAVRGYMPSYDWPVTTLQEAAAHWREWFDRGEFDEGAARGEEALKAPGADAPSLDRVRVLSGAHL